MTPLRRRMIEDMRIRNLSPHTQKAYVEQVSRFARHFGRPPELLGRDEIRSWQIYLIEERQFDFGRRGRPPVCLYGHPQKALDCRRRHPNQPATEETPRCPEPGGSRPIPGRGEQPQASDDPDRVLRDGAANFRGGFAEARRDRQPADGHSGGGGQRPEGPVRDALADAVEVFANLLEGGSPKRMAVSWRSARAAY